MNQCEYTLAVYSKDAFYFFVEFVGEVAVDCQFDLGLEVIVLEDGIAGVVAFEALDLLAELVGEVGATVLPLAVLEADHLADDVEVVLLGLGEDLVVGPELGLEVFVEAEGEVQNVLEGLGEVVEEVELFPEGLGLLAGEEEEDLLELADGVVHHLLGHLEQLLLEVDVLLELPEGDLLVGQPHGLDADGLDVPQPVYELHQPLLVLLVQERLHNRQVPRFDLQRSARPVQRLEDEGFVGEARFPGLLMAGVVPVDPNEVVDWVVVVLDVGQHEVSRQVEHYLVEFDRAALDDQRVLVVVDDELEAAEVL